MWYLLRIYNKQERKKKRNQHFLFELSQSLAKTAPVRFNAPIFTAQILAHPRAPQINPLTKSVQNGLNTENGMSSRIHRMHCYRGDNNLSIWFRAKWKIDIYIKMCVYQIQCATTNEIVMMARSNIAGIVVVVVVGLSIILFKYISIWFVIVVGNFRTQSKALL